MSAYPKKADGLRHRKEYARIHNETSVTSEESGVGPQVDKSQKIKCSSQKQTYKYNYWLTRVVLTRYINFIYGMFT